MNLAVWAQMQPLEVLERVDEMLGHVLEDVLEEDLKQISSLPELTFDEIRNSSIRGRTKVAAGLTLVSIGVAGLLDPSKAWQAQKIQLAFALAGAYIGSFIAPGLGGVIGWGIGSVVGGIVAAVYLYAIPLLGIVGGIYLIVEGLYEMMIG